MIHGFVYEAMTVQELLYNIRVITAILEQRCVYATQSQMPFMASAPQEGDDVSAWSKISPKVLSAPETEVLPPALPAPQITQLKVCNDIKCPCYYNIQKDDGNPQRIKLDPYQLFLFGVDSDIHCMTEREKIADLLGDDLRSVSINVKSGREYAFIKFKHHSTAAKAQQLLVKHGYVVNFRKE